MLEQRQRAERRRVQAGRGLRETVWMDREPWVERQILKEGLEGWGEMGARDLENTKD